MSAALEMFNKALKTTAVVSVDKTDAEYRVIVTSAPDNEMDRGALIQLGCKITDERDKRLKPAWLPLPPLRFYTADGTRCVSDMDW